MEELTQKINIILNEEKRAYAIKGRRSGGLGSFNINIGDGGFISGQIPQILNDASATDAIQSPNANILLKLYSKITPEAKVEMRTYLISQLTKEGPYCNVAYLIFFVLYRIGFVIIAIEKARVSLKGDLEHGYSNMLGIFAKIIRHEYANISGQEYQLIKKAMEGEDESNFGLLEKINNAEIKLLEQELEDVNPEINSDRDRVLDIWSTKFGSSVVPSLVKEVEEYFYEAEYTPTKYATALGRIRVFISESTKEIAMKVSSKLNDKKKIPDLTEHSIFDYLRSTKIISDNEWNLLRIIYGMASNEGAHSAITNREYARIIRNISYETILMLLEHSDEKF